MKISPALKEKLQRVKLLAMDVDGVLTDGGVYVLADGTEFRRFNIKDGLGIKRVTAAGISVVWISAGTCEAIRHRAIRLGVDHVYLGVEDKTALLARFCQEHGFELGEVAYIGDDLTDLEVMGFVGVPCSPSDAVVEIQNSSLLIIPVRGGYGTVRNLCDILLQVG